MVEHELSHLPHFAESFEVTTSLALENRHILWCKVERQDGDDDVAEPAPQIDVKFYELAAIEDETGAFHEPSSSVGYDVPGNYHWYEWMAAKGRGGAETIIERVDADAIEAGYHRWPPTRYSGFKEATIPRLVDIFSKLATTAPELETITDRLVNWLMVTESFTAKDKGTLIAAVQDVVIKDLAFTDYGGESGVANKLQQAADTSMGQEIVRWVNFALGGVLIKRATGSYTEEAVQKVDGATITSAIEAYDRAGLIADDFWIDFGVRAGGAIVNSEFLPILHAKLTGEDGLRLLQSYRDAQSITREYISSLLMHHKVDPSRHGMNVEKIIQSTSPTGRPHSNTDLTKLVQLSNGLVQQLNSMRYADTSEENLLAALEPADMLSVSDALLRVLYLSRRADLPQGDRVAQFEQDILHAEIVSLIREGTFYRRASVLGHAALTFPESSADQIQKLEQLLKTGSSYGDHSLDAISGAGQTYRSKLVLVFLSIRLIATFQLAKHGMA